MGPTGRPGRLDRRASGIHAVVGKGEAGAGAALSKGLPPRDQLPRPAWDHRAGPRTARDRRGCEDGQIGVAAGEPVEADLAIADGCKLATQQVWRGAVPGRRAEGVDDAD